MSSTDHSIGKLTIQHTSGSTVMLLKTLLCCRHGNPAALHVLPAVVQLFTVSNTQQQIAWYATQKQPSGPLLGQDALVDSLQQQGLLTERATKAMRAVDRGSYVQAYTGVPPNIAYQDTPVPIGCGQHMDPPSIVARVLSLLEPHIQPGARVLDVGTGTGYSSACLAQLAAPNGAVLALEKQASLVARAQANVKASSPKLLQSGAVQFRVCNVMSKPEELQGQECFDAIHLGASVEQAPEQFLRLLARGGRLVLPLGAMHGAAPQTLVAIDKTPDGSIMQTDHGAISNRIAPLTALHDDQVTP